MYLLEHTRQTETIMYDNNPVKELQTYFSAQAEPTIARMRDDQLYFDEVRKALSVSNTFSVTSIWYRLPSSSSP